MDDQRSSPDLPHREICPPNGDGSPIDFPGEELIKSLGPLGLSPDQTSAVLDCVKETMLRWLVLHMDLAVEQTVRVVERIVRSCVQEVAAGAINDFGSYAVLCVQHLTMQNEDLKMRHFCELSRWKEYASHLMFNLNQQKEIAEKENERLQAELDAMKREHKTLPIPTQKRRSLKRKGHDEDSCERVQQTKRTSSTRTVQKKLIPRIHGFSANSSPALNQRRTTCTIPSMKLPALEVPPSEADTIDQMLLCNSPPCSAGDRRAVEDPDAAGVCSETDHLCEQGVGSDIIKEDVGSLGLTSVEHSVLTSSNPLEDNESGASDEDGRKIVTTNVSGQVQNSVGQPSGLKSSSTVAKQRSEEGDNLHSVLGSDVEKDDTRAALFLCQLGESGLPRRLPNIAPQADCKSPHNGASDSVTKEYTKPSVGNKPCVTATKRAGKEEKRVFSRRRGSNVGKEKSGLGIIASNSEEKVYPSRDHRRLSIVAKQLLALSERKHR